MAAKPLLICLMGPTASGKTALAVELAERLQGELVSVDATLVYRGLDIGSAKPAYPHRLVDIRDPAEPYSAADFVDDARRAVTEISAAGRLPVLVGGTMLYFKAALEGLAAMPPADPVIRAAIAADARARGWPQLHRELAAVDPAAAARIHPNHTQRLGRALEVYRASGTPLSVWQRTGAGRAWTLAADFRVLQLALAPADRAVLHARIASRFDDMLAAGLLQEVRELRRRGDLHPGLPAIRAVGYRQLWQHLDGEISLEEAVQKAVAATRQLAKRQFTWLRKWPDLAWIHTDSGNRVLQTDWDARCPGQCGRAPCEAVLNYLALEAPKQK